MPVFHITSPEGKTYEVTGPDGATADQALEQVKRQHADTAQASAPVADAPGMVASLGAGAGAGFGKMVLGAQNLAGKGLSALGGVGHETSLSDLVAPPQPNLLQRAGNWLQQDAQTGQARLSAENAPYKAANPITNATGEFGGEMVAAAPVGGVLAAPLKVAARSAPILAPVADAIATSGMRAGGITNPLASLAVRSAGGALTGGATAALLNPDEAGAGALVGAALPGGLQLAGAAGKAIGNVIRGPAQSPELAAAVNAARGSGYVIPPSQANPTLANRLLEGVSGKITTAQNASARNQTVTNDLAAQAVGLPAGTPITPQALKTVRDGAGQAYQAISNTGVITPGPAYTQALDAITASAKKAAAGFPNDQAPDLIAKIDALKSPQFDASSAVAKIKSLRNEADKAFAGGDKDLGRALRDGAGALEDAIDQHLQQIGQPDLLQEFRDARQLIAKTYSVEKAMNVATGTVDAKKLAAQAQRGKPLSGGLEDAASFAARFPKAAQTPETMGSLPQTSPLDWHAGGAMSFATGNPLAMLGVGARPAARALVLSPFVQNRLIQAPQSALPALTGNALAGLAYRGAPIAVGGQ